MDNNNIDECNKNIAKHDKDIITNVTNIDKLNDNMILLERLKFLEQLKDLKKADIEIILDINNQFNSISQQIKRLFATVTILKNEFRKFKKEVSVKIK